MFKQYAVKDEAERNMTAACLPARYQVALLAFLGVLFNYLLRVNINFALVAMVRHDSKPLTTHNATFNATLSAAFNATLNETLASVSSWAPQEGEALPHDVCPSPDGNTKPHTSYSGDLPWDEWTQGLVAGAFFYGNVWTQLPGGRLAELWGPRRVLGGALLSAALLTLLQPLAARASYILLILIRILVGLSLGVTSPANHVLLSGWAPPLERSTLSALIYAGAPAGTLVAFPVSAYIIEVAGWEAVFYLQGLLALAWCLVWFLVVTDSPDDFRWISHHEKNYISSSIGTSKSKTAGPMPWRRVLSSPPVWAVVVAALGNNWGFYTLLSAVPLYTKTILHQDIKSNAGLSGMPYVGMWMFSLGGGVASDWLLQRGRTSTVAVRKVSHVLANIGPAACLVGLMWVGCHFWATVALLMLAVTVQGAIYSGHYVNPLDLSPNFAGTLCGITNTLANIPGFLAPMTAGFLINNQQTLTQWRKVFGIAAAIYTLNTIFYLIFASGEEQPWNSPRPKHSESGCEEGGSDDQDRTCHQRENSTYQKADHQEVDNPIEDKNHNVKGKGPYSTKCSSENEVIQCGNTCHCGWEGTQFEQSCQRKEEDSQHQNIVSYSSTPGEDSGHEDEPRQRVGQGVVPPTPRTQRKGHVNHAFSTEE